MFHLSLRATQGFLESVLALLRLELPVPDYSTLSRRQPRLAMTLPYPTSERPRHIVVDSTGVKVYGAGEWHAGKYRRNRRRFWRKLHLGVDETTRDIVAVEVTTSRVDDSKRSPTLLSQVTENIAQVSADRAYDARACYESIVSRGAVPTILPRKNARLGSSVDPPAWSAAREPMFEKSKRKVDLDGECRPVALDEAWRRRRCRDSKLCLEEGSGLEPSKVSRSKLWSSALRSTG